MKTFGDWVRHFIETGIANEQNAISLVQAAQLRGEIEVLPELPLAQDPNYYYRDENGLYHVLEHPQPGLPLYRKAQDGNFQLVSKSVDSKGTPKTQIQRPKSIIDDLRRGKPHDPVKEYRRYQQTPWLIDPLDDIPHPANFHVDSAYDVWDEDEIDYADMDPLGSSSRQAGYRGRFADRGYGHEYHMVARQTQLSPCGPEYNPECFADPAPDEYFTTVYGQRVLLEETQLSTPKTQELAHATMMVLAQYNGWLNPEINLSAIEQLAFKINLHEHSTIEDPVARKYLYDLVLYTLLGTSGQGVDMPIKQFGLDQINALLTIPGIIKDAHLNANTPLIERWMSVAIGGMTSAIWRVWQPKKDEAFGVRDDEFFNLLLTPLSLENGNISWGEYGPMPFEDVAGHATVEYMEELRSGTKQYVLSNGDVIKFDPQALKTFANWEFVQGNHAGAQSSQDYYTDKIEDPIVNYSFKDESGVSQEVSVPLYWLRFDGAQRLGDQFDLFVMERWQVNLAREVRLKDYEIADDAAMRRAMCESDWVCFKGKCKVCTVDLGHGCGTLHCNKEQT